MKGTTSERRTKNGKKTGTHAGKNIVSSNGNAFSHLVVRHCADALLVVDSSRAIRFMNPAAEQLLGESAEDMIGRKIPYPVDPTRSLEVTIQGPGRESGVAEMRAVEIRDGRKRMFAVSLRDITGRVRLQEHLLALSNVDPLTGLLNRRGFLGAAQQMLSLAERTRREMGLFFIDLDGLKMLNDTLGHIGGDQALTEFSEVLRKTFRRPDVIGRFGGDEFAVLAVEAKSRNARQIAKRLKKNLEEHNRKKGRKKKLSISLGCAFFHPEKPAQLDDLVDAADLRMYREKRAKELR